MQDSSNLQFDLFGNIIKYDLEMIIVVALIIVVVFLVWLILRVPRLWYWKISQRTEKLKEIEARLEMIRERIEEVVEEAEADNLPSKNLAMSGIPIVTAKEPIDMKHIKAEDNQVSNEVKDKPVETQDNINKVEIEDKIIIQDEQYIGKSGKVYSRKDLEAKIKK